MLSFVIADIYNTSQNLYNIKKMKKYNHSTKELRANVNKNLLNIYNSYKMKGVKSDPFSKLDFKTEKYKWNTDYTKFILLNESQSCEKTHETEKKNENDKEKNYESNNKSNNDAKDNKIYSYQLAAFTFATLFIGIGIYSFNRSF
jgi:hypothetical protein